MPSPKNMRQVRHIAGKKISKHAMAEFGVGMSEYIFCPKGEAVYYKKSWHHGAVPKLLFVRTGVFSCAKTPEHDQLRTSHDLFQVMGE